MNTLTYEQLYTLTTELLDGVAIDDTLFGILLNQVRLDIESARPWVVLRKIDKSISINQSNKWTDAHNLPTDFVTTIDDSKLQLFDGLQNIQDYTEIPYPQILDYKDTSDAYAIDYANMQFYVLGQVATGSFTIWLPYIADFGNIVAGSTWLKFPGRFHPILAYGVSVLQKAGIDYDAIAAQSALYNDRTYQTMLNSMKKWDSRLQLQMTQNRDFNNPNIPPYRTGVIRTQQP